MAKLTAISDAVVVLDGKVQAHLDADGTAVAALIAQNEALQKQVADLTAALADAGATPEEIAAVVASIEAIGAKL